MPQRKKIPQEFIDILLFQSNHTCCKCNIPNKPVQVHHIDENSSNNTVANLIVLCLECHSIVHTKGGFGKGYSGKLLLKYKKDWIRRVKVRKKDADRLASIHSATGKELNTGEDDDLYYKDREDQYILKMYLDQLVKVHQSQLMISKAHWDDGRTFEMIHGSTRMIDFYEAVMVELSTYFPKGHFGNRHPRLFFSEQIASRGIFHSRIAEPRGDDTGGTMARMCISGRVMDDLKFMVRDMATQLIETFFGPDIKYHRSWVKGWVGEGKR
jgi:5-methylcytosine-specific restriction endonuclease McrA